MANIEDAIYAILSTDATAGPLLCAHGLSDGDTVRLRTSASDLPAPLLIDTTYYIVSATATTFKLALSSGGTAVNITDVGTVPHWCCHGPKYRESFAFTAAVTDICTATTYRIYPLVMPQARNVPAVTYQRISGPNTDSIAAPGGLCMSRYQLNCWASSHAGAGTLADAVETALNVYYTGGVVAGMTIGGVILEDDGDLPDISSETEERNRYAIRQDWHIIYET